MASPSTPENEDNKIYALINYQDPYVQPLILSALQKHLPPTSYTLITTPSCLPTPSTPYFQFQQYESLDFTHHLAHPQTSLCNSYIIRKALIRKHYLSTTVRNWLSKYPNSALARHVKLGVEFEVDYAEFLDEALVEAWELLESWRRGEGKGPEGREWWILKPGMSERGQGIRLFSSEEELVKIFEGWDPESDDENDDDDDADNTTTRSDDGSPAKQNPGTGIITSHLRHFIAQPYIHPPLLLPPPNSSSPAPTKFHIRTYVLAVGALKIYIYNDMLALFAAAPYTPPWETCSSANQEEALRAHLTNTCLQDSSTREGTVGLFWDLPDQLPTSSSSPSSPKNDNWKEDIASQIQTITSEIFTAAARSMSVHFQALPNSFEIFGLDFMVSREEDGVRAWLLEVNAFPDFAQTGDELRGLVEGLFEGVVKVAVCPFFGGDVEGSEGEGEGKRKMVKVLDIDLGRR